MLLKIAFSCISQTTAEPLGSSINLSTDHQTLVTFDDLRGVAGDEPTESQEVRV